MENSRREFVATVIGATVLGASVASASEGRKKKAAGSEKELPLVDPTKGMAVSVKYVHAHSDLKDASLKTARNGVAWDKQFCNNCILHKPVAGKTDVVSCSLFPGQVVKAKGWCNSWAKQG